MSDELNYRTASFRDTLAAAQLAVERQLTGMLITLPALTLTVSAPFVPEIGQTECRLWQKCRALRLENKSESEALGLVYGLIFNDNDFYSLYCRGLWNFDDYDRGLSHQIILDSLSEIKILQAARRGMELLSKRPELIELGACHA